MNPQDRPLKKNPESPQTSAASPYDIQDMLTEAMLHHQSGRLTEAEKLYLEVLEIAPQHAQVCNNLGGIYFSQRKLNGARAYYERAISLKPDFVEAHNNLGLLLRDSNEVDAALNCFIRACTINPNFAEGYYNLGTTLLPYSMWTEAFGAFRKAAQANPANGLFWAHMAGALQNMSFSTITDDTLFDDLSRMLDHPAVSPENLSNALVSALLCQPDFALLLDRVANAEAERNVDMTNAAERFSTFPVFLQLLRFNLVNNQKMEKTLALLRKHFVLEAVNNTPLEKGMPFYTALAFLCFVNEYVYDESAEEEEAIALLREKLEAGLKEGRPVPNPWIVAFAAYRPLHSLNNANKLREQSRTKDIQALVVQQIEEPLAEQALRSSIPCLTPLDDAISQAVREQYEENPYPRWTKAGVYPKTEPVKSTLQKLFPHQDFGSFHCPENPEILIAGCGTGKQPLSLTHLHINARVLAIDLSLSSLAYATRKTRELGINNIEYAQADILELNALNRQFDVIECGGVLHHLADPMAGWRILTNLLRKGGLMKIALYSELARRPIVKARALIAEKGYSTSPHDIRQCRRDIRAASNDPYISNIPNISDFYSTSTCRDLLFHVQEHRFSLVQIKEALEILGLNFIGFEIKNPAITEKFKSLYPDPTNLADLSLWHAFEQDHPMAFISMYQFWCQKI